MLRKDLPGGVSTCCVGRETETTSETSHWWWVMFPLFRVFRFLRGEDEEER